MNTVYKLKKNFDEEKLKELGYIYLEDSKDFVKVIEQPLGSGPVQYLLNNYYENKKWRKLFYNKNKKEMKDKLKLNYDRKGNIIYNDEFVEMLTTWFIEIDETNWVGLTSADQFDTNVFYNKKVLDSYCEKEIEILKEHDLIEEEVV